MSIKNIVPFYESGVWTSLRFFFVATSRSDANYIESDSLGGHQFDMST